MSSEPSKQRSLTSTALHRSKPPQRLDYFTKAQSKAANHFLVLLWSLFVATEAFAQGNEPDHFYLGIAVGPIIPQSVNTNLSGTISGTGTLQFNASGFVRLLAGYRVTDHVGIDAEDGFLTI